MTIYTIENNIQVPTSNTMFSNIIIQEQGWKYTRKPKAHQGQIECPYHSKHLITCIWICWNADQLFDLYNI